MFFKKNNVFMLTNSHNGPTCRPTPYPPSFWAALRPWRSPQGRWKTRRCLWSSVPGRDSCLLMQPHRRRGWPPQLVSFTACPNQDGCSRLKLSTAAVVNRPSPGMDTGGRWGDLGIAQRLDFPHMAQGDGATALSMKKGRTSLCSGPLKLNGRAAFHRVARGGALTERKAAPGCTAGPLRGERAGVPKGPPQRARRGGRGLLCTHQSGHFGVVWALAGSQRGRARFLLLLHWRCPC